MRRRNSQTPDVPPQFKAENEYLKQFVEEKRRRGYFIQAEQIERLRKMRLKQVTEENKSIVRVDTARRGRPPLVEIHGGSTAHPSIPVDTQIVGARIPGEPQILDKTSKIEQHEPEIVQHETIVNEGEGSIRKRAVDPEAPEVRFRNQDTEAWRRVKGLQDDT